MRNAQPNSDKLILNRIAKAKGSGPKSLDLSVRRNTGLRLTEIPDAVFELDQLILQLPKLKKLKLQGTIINDPPPEIQAKD